jgi:hypothetical protein
MNRYVYLSRVRCSGEWVKTAAIILLDIKQHGRTLQKGINIGKIIE